MLGAEQLAAPASESGQSDLPPASRAPIHDALRRRLVVLRSIRRLRLRSRLIARVGSLGRTRSCRSGSLIVGEFRRRRNRFHGGGRRRCGGGVEALLAHAVGGRVAGDAAVVDARDDGIRNLELGLFVLGFLSHKKELRIEMVWVLFEGLGLLEMKKEEERGMCLGRKKGKENLLDINREGCRVRAREMRMKVIGRQIRI